MSGAVARVSGRLSRRARAVTGHVAPAALAVATLLLTIGLAAADPPGACTAKGCNPAFIIKLMSAGALEAGNYEIQLRLDGATTDCHYRLAADCLQACGTARGAACYPAQALTCTGDARWMFPGLWPNCDGSPVSVIGIWDKAREVSLRVSKDGRLLGRRTYRPRYEVSHPNGPGCSPECWISPAGTFTLRGR